MKNKINIEENLGLVHLCCQRFRGKTAEYDELFQCGCIGLIKAAKNFDFSRNIKFSTYAVPVILGEIRAFFRDNNLLKVSRNLKDLSIKIKKFSEKFSAENSREPSINEICAALSVDTEQVLEALEINKPLVSLDDDNQKNKEPAADFEDENISLRVALSGAMQNFKPDDKKLIYLRFFKLETQTSVAKKLGMTQVQVSRREKVLIKELRKKLV